MGSRRRQHDLGTVAALQAAVCLWGGCSPARELPPVKWEGEHLRYRSDAQLGTVCEGTFQYLDDRVAHLQRVFETSDRKVDYVWAPENALETYCDSSLGCSDGETAFSKVPLCEHELFHALRGATAHRGLEEGMAVFFGDDREIPGAVGDDVEEILKAAGPRALPNNLDYPTLGHFVSYLHAEFGLDSIAQIDRATSIDDGYGKLSAVVGDVVGVPLAEILSDYRADYPVCTNRDYRYAGFDCSGEGVTLPGIGSPDLAFATRVGCDDSETLGPRGAEVWKTIALHIPMRGRYEFTILPDDFDAARGRLSSCGSSCLDLDPELGWEWSGLGAVPYCLAAGTVLLRLAALDDAPVEYDVTIRLLDPSESCP